MSSENMNEKLNRLANEKSPYLLQHAHNPVDWYPWSDEAFQMAKELDRPIFLSIGYSCCHWCHVMAHESFEDEEVAEILNESFISIKVDREERPDIDNIYMNTCQMLTGSGGWPLSIIMTPDQKPFFAGTYFPKYDRNGMQGLISILERVKNAWENDKGTILNSSRQITNALSKPSDSSITAFNDEIFKEAYSQFKLDYDVYFGGFGNAPKFPSPQNLLFLLRYWYVSGEAFSLTMVENTLDAMYKGGLYDHIGYGFSRYSTDRKWIVPHFEKMLYDNALLAIAYIETFQVTGKSKYSEIAQQIFTYVLRDMTSAKGGFYSAEDADSEGIEGKFYTWKPEEVNSVLGENEGRRFCKYFNINVKGNFEGRSIANLVGTNIPEHEIKFIEDCKAKLFSFREKRIHPHKDDKILTSWNGLMIAALALGGRVFHNRKYILAAEEAVEFISENLTGDKGRLLTSYREEKASVTAFLDDYAFLIWGLIELYQVDYKPEYLQKAVELNEDILKYFWDNVQGGLFVYGSDSEQLITRPKEIYDGAIPSGNSVSALNLIRLARLTGEFKYEEKAHQLLKTFGGEIESFPKAYAFSLMSLLFLNEKGKEIIISTEGDRSSADEILEVLDDNFMPFTVSILYSPEKRSIKSVIPFIEDYSSNSGKATAYVCSKSSCKSPVTELDDFKRLIFKA